MSSPSFAATLGPDVLDEALLLQPLKRSYCRVCHELLPSSLQHILRAVRNKLFTAEFTTAS